MAKKKIKDENDNLAALRELLLARPRRESLNLYSTIYKMEEECVKFELEGQRN